MTNPTNDFCVFILTHGRPNKIYTLKTLKKQGYTGPLFFICDDEDPKLERYKELYGDKVIVFNKKEVAETFDEADNFYKDRRTIVYARNFCFQAARQLGFKYFLELDDDYIHFRFTLDKFKNYTVQMCKNLDEVFNIFLTYFKSIPAKSIAMAQGGDILGGGKSKTLRNGKIKRKAMNTFFCSVDRPFQFVGRINEDVNTYVSLGAVGEIFMTLTNICITQNQTQKNKRRNDRGLFEQRDLSEKFLLGYVCPVCRSNCSYGGQRKAHTSPGELEICRALDYPGKPKKIATCFFC